MALSPIKSLQHTACRIAGHKTRQEITQELDTRLTSMAQKIEMIKIFTKGSMMNFVKKLKMILFTKTSLKKYTPKHLKGLEKKHLSSS